MADDFCERYGDLLTGSYDCVDRIVLNAYFPLGHNPGGFRCWWRRLHGGSDDDLDNTHLMRFAGRFARRVKAWANANGVPLLVRKPGISWARGSVRRCLAPPDLGERGQAVAVCSSPVSGLTAWMVTL